MDQRTDILNGVVADMQAEMKRLAAQKHYEVPALTVYEWCRLLKSIADAPAESAPDAPAPDDLFPSVKPQPARFTPRQLFQMGWDAGFQEAQEPDRYPHRNRCEDAWLSLPTAARTEVGGPR